MENWKTTKLTEIGIDNWKVEWLSQLESTIGMANHPCSACVSQPAITATTTDLGIWLNGKIGLYLEDLANPKNNADLVPNCL